jgi:hypothetical protein
VLLPGYPPGPRGPGPQETAPDHDRKASNSGRSIRQWIPPESSEAVSMAYGSSAKPETSLMKQASWTQGSGIAIRTTLEPAPPERRGSNHAKV